MNNSPSNEPKQKTKRDLDIPPPSREEVVESLRKLLRKPSTPNTSKK